MKKIFITIILILGIGMGLFVGNIMYPKDSLTEINKNWKVYFSNLSTSVLHGAVYVPENPIIESTSLKAYDVLITKPGDYATYTFDIVNDGDYDAKLTSLIKVSPMFSLDIIYCLKTNNSGIINRRCWLSKHYCCNRSGSKNYNACNNNTSYCSSG